MKNIRKMLQQGQPANQTPPAQPPTPAPTPSSPTQPTNKRSSDPTPTITSPSSSSSFPFFSSLLPELTSHITTSLDARSHHSLSQVSRSFHKLCARSSDAESFWRGKCIQIWRQTSKPWLPENSTILIDQNTGENFEHEEWETKERVAYWKAVFAILVRFESDLPTTFREHEDGEVVLVEQDILKLHPSRFARAHGDRCVRSDQSYPNPFSVAQYPTLIPHPTLQNTFTCTWLRCFYYEVNVQEQTSGRDCLAVGLAHRNYPSNFHQPGWRANSYAYHSDDGHKFHGSGFGHRYGPSFEQFATVGCGLTLASPVVFYTHNGTDLGNASNLHNATELNLFPTLGVSLTSGVKFNFGARPFAFNVLSSERRQPNLKSTLFDPRWFSRVRARLENAAHNDDDGENNPTATTRSVGSRPSSDEITLDFDGVSDGSSDGEDSWLSDGWVTASDEDVDSERANSV